MLQRMPKTNLLRGIRSETRRGDEEIGGRFDQVDG